MLGTVISTECEMCGSNSELIKAHVENAFLNVCRRCAKLGHVLKEEIALPVKRHEPRIEITELIPDFSAAIRTAREAKKLTRKELAQKIKEKESVVARIENGMRPTRRLAEKLEKELGVSLAYKEREHQIPAAKTEPLTLGDVVEIRMKKKV